MAARTSDEMFTHASTRAPVKVADLPRAPARRVAVLTCMDARIDLAALFGLALGDANVLRNAGGVVTADVRRTLAISQRLLGTTEIVVLGHTGCGMLDVDDQEFTAVLREETGQVPDWPVAGFRDLDERVRQSVAELAADPFLPARDVIRGVVYDLASGEVREVR
ncbi:MAG: carbonic anhydrase [Streptosporangiales bacterium]|nr:carbonic anhydrase [Streptosporangiales bacterium]